MKRRDLIMALAGTGMGLNLLKANTSAHPVNTKLDFDSLDKTKQEWQALLNRDQFNILFDEGTELAGSSVLNFNKKTGTYICAACYLPLFKSETKYDSGTGWPSFYQAISGRIANKLDLKLIWPRTEYHCRRCGGHQGHVFEDGPEPTRLRYCNNGLALLFVPENQPLPDLRG